MGEPAGGSLSADEYKLATVVVLPLIVCRARFHLGVLLIALTDSYNMGSLSR